MDKLIEDYNNKCQVISNKSDNMWKNGLVILFILFSIYYFFTNKKIICVFAVAIIISVWFSVCVFVYDKELKKNVSNMCIKTSKKEKKKYSEYEEILDKYQKDFISNYIRKNKLNKLGKLDIIINEIQQEVNKKAETKNIFVIPSVLTLFTSVANYDSNIGLLAFIIQYGVLIISAILVITAFYKLYD